MKISFEDFESLDNGFINLDKKTKKLLPIIQDYYIKDLATAIFAITSWRDNRSAQESCLALNAALVECSSCGIQRIASYEDFLDFFEKIKPILEITHLDDSVINDFGEVQLCFDGKFYPVITGTGHTGSVYAAIQFLENLSLELEKKAQTMNLLEYLKCMIDSLKCINQSRYDNSPIVFDIPPKQFFDIVKEYIKSNPTEKLDLKTLHTLTYPHQPLVKIHFIQKTEGIYPLFNPSLIIDYYTCLLKEASFANIKNHIHSTLYQKIEKIHMSQLDKVKDILIYQSNVAIDNKPAKIKAPTLLYVQDKNVILFIDVDEMDNREITKYTNELRKTHKENRLGFIDLSNPVDKNKFFGVNVPNYQPLNIILFNQFTNLDETYFQFGGRDDQLILTSLDLMYLLCVSKDIGEIVDFMDYHTQEQAQVLSWGGISDLFSVWKQEKGFISKGAIEYSTLYTEFETSAAYIFDMYSQWQKCFPFHLTNMQMGFPEQWKIILDDNNVYQFVRKGMNFIGGSVFLLENHGVVFCSYDLLSIMQNQNTQDASNLRDLVSGLNERFIIEYSDQLNGINLLKNVFINIQCNSLNTNHEKSQYVHIVAFKTEANKVDLLYTVDSNKLVKDISSSVDRSIESQFFLELLNPFFEKYTLSLDALKEIIINDSGKSKTVNTMIKELDYYMNPDYLPIRLTDEGLIATRKIIAKIAAEKGVEPGKYTQKDATKVVRNMQESLVKHFEGLISQFDRLTLHSILLHHYSSELLASYINYGGYGLTNEIDKSLRQKNKEKLITAREENKQMQVTLLYLIETNLFLETNRGNKAPNTTDVENLLAFSHWLGILQSYSDICFHTASDTCFIILDDYRVNVELGEAYQTLLDSLKKRTYESEVYVLQGDAIDKEHFEKVVQGFFFDTGIDFRSLESVLKQLMECSFPSELIDFYEINPNVIRISKADAIKDCQNFIVESVPVQMIQKVYDFLTLSPEKLKTITNQQHNVLPVWDRKQRNNRFEVTPLLSVGDSYIYSPVMIKELRDRWVNGLLQFYPPYEIGLDNSLSALWEWKERYEHFFSFSVRDAFREKNYVFAEADVDIRRWDRKGNHPSINILGDFDVIALDLINKKIFIIECKFLQPIGSVFEHSMEQNRFFVKEKYDEKFQKRIDYIKGHYKSFFTNLGFDLADEEYDINTYMVVNKVFNSYYKKIDFNIVTYDELKKII